MLDPDTVFVANAAGTASDVIDGEAVIIHFERGTYFSIGGLGAVVWSLMQTPVTRNGLLEAMRQTGAPADAAFAANLDAFVGTLAENELVLATADAPQTPAVPVTDPAVFSQPLKVEAFTDLADLIAIDPVHEVDVLTGWPRRAAEQVDAKNAGAAEGS